ncbi:MAG: hypothetical protein JWN48_4196, partial [Myxococcaceae bacterium]|nr:hypothetical protein [Myxococcaceae bacterium]
LRVEARTRGAFLLGLGLRGLRNAYFAELLASGQLFSSIAPHSAAGRVREDEWSAALTTRLGKQWQGFALGLLGALEVVSMSARGVTNDGSRGHARVLAARLDLGLDLRATLLDGPARVSLRLAPTLQVAPAVQRFRLDRETTLELGRAALWLPLTLLVELPTGAAS